MVAASFFEIRPSSFSWSIRSILFTAPPCYCSSFYVLAQIVLILLIIRYFTEKIKKFLSEKKLRAFPNRRWRPRCRQSDSRLVWLMSSRLC
jgi:hypothetical protein